MIKKIPFAGKGTNYYYRLVMITLLIALLPVMLLSFFYYHNTMNTLKLELHNANSNYLNQTANAMEVVINQITNSFQQFTMESALQTFESFPNGGYYERLSGQLKESDLPALDRYLISKAKVWKNLDIMNGSNEYIFSVHLIDRSKEVILSSFRSQQELLPMLDTISVAGDAKTYPYFREVQQVYLQGEGTKLILPLIYVTPNPNETNIVVVNLDAEKIYKSIVQKLDNSGENRIFILDQERKPIIYDNRNDLYKVVNEYFADNGNSSDSRKPVVLTREGKKLLITSKSSAMLGWTLVSVVDIDQLYRSISQLRGLILTVSVIASLIVALIAMLTSRNIYRPISRLAAYIRKLDPTGKPEWPTVRGNEFSMIQNSFEASVENQHRLQLRLKESLPAYREKFLASLTKTHKFSREELEERIQFLGIELELNDLLLLNVYFERSQGKNRDFETQNLDRLHLIDIWRHRLISSGNGIVIEMEEDLLTVIVNCQADRLQEIFTLAECAREDANRQLGISCLVGIGRHCADIHELGQAFEEAREAVRCRNLAGTGAVVFIGDVLLERINVFLYPIEKETMLNDFIKNGETENAKRVFAEMADEIKEHEGRIQFHQVQRVFFRLLTSLMETANRLRLDLETMLQAKNNLYHQLLQKRNVLEIVGWFEELIHLFGSYVETVYKTKNDFYIDEVMKLVENNYGSPITLTWVAEEVHLNPSYLSRMFKEKTGIGFMEYVTSVRIEKSKRLLLETELRLNDICGMLGYQKVNYFIRIFKQATGMTPGEYRKSYTGNESV